MTEAARFSFVGIGASSQLALRQRSRPIPHSLPAFCCGLLFSGRTLFVMVTARWLNSGTEPGVLAGFFIAATLGLVATICAFGKRLSPHRSEWTSRPVQWVLLYLIVSGCSLSWTASSSVSSSALYWLSLVGDVAIVVLIFRGAGSKSAAPSLLKGFIAGSCALAAIAWLMPGAADLRLGDLDYFNTNQIGNLCALAFLMCSLLAARADRVWQLVPWFLAITVLRSMSKATLVAFVACLLYRLVRDKSIRTRRKWLVSLAAVTLVVPFWGLLIAYYGVYATSGNQAETLTGRTAIWLWTFDAACQRPWFGNGFDSMWKIAPPFGGELFEARHAENELLQQFFAYGACGIALLGGVYGSLWRRIRAVARGPERIALTSFLIYVGIRGFAEAEPFDLLLPLWLVTALGLLLNQNGQCDLRCSLWRAPSPDANARSVALKGSR